MGKLHLTSNITFLYFKDLDAARPFFTDVLGLETAFDPKWACVYRLGEKSYLGAVDDAAGIIHVESRDGVLISLTVSNIEEAHAHISACGFDPSDIKLVRDIALQSFVFTGPEGYKFEVEQFSGGALSHLF